MQIVGATPCGCPAFATHQALDPAAHIDRRDFGRLHRQGSGSGRLTPPAHPSYGTSSPTPVMTKFWCASCHSTVTTSPGLGKAATSAVRVSPHITSWPRVVTVTVRVSTTAPSITNRTVCSPSPTRFQLYNSPKPVSGSPSQRGAVSGRTVPAAAWKGLSGSSPISNTMLSASQTQPDNTLRPL